MAADDKSKRKRNDVPTMYQSPGEEVIPKEKEILSQKITPRREQPLLAKKAGRQSMRWSTGGGGVCVSEP
jgi:hypothetical protein